MSFAPRIEFEFLKPCFLFSFIFSRISRTQIHEFSTYIGFRLRHSRLLGTKSYPRTQIQSWTVTYRNYIFGSTYKEWRMSERK